VTLVFEIIFIVLSIGVLVAGYALAGLYSLAIASLGIGLFWLLALWRRWSWSASVGFILTGVAAGFGIWFGISPVLITISVLGSLLAWDLSDFQVRLQSAHPEDNVPRLEQKHLIRIAILGLVGLSLSLAALVIRIQFRFEWIFLLALAAVWGITQLANRLRRN